MRVEKPLREHRSGLSRIVQAARLARGPKLVPTQNAEKLREVKLARALKRLDLGALFRPRRNGDSELPHQRHQPLSREHLEDASLGNGRACHS